MPPIPRRGVHYHHGDVGPAGITKINHGKRKSSFCRKIKECEIDNAGPSIITQHYTRIWGKGANSEGTSDGGGNPLNNGVTGTKLIQQLNLNQEQKIENDLGVLVPNWDLASAQTSVAKLENTRVEWQLYNLDTHTSGQNSLGQFPLHVRLWTLEPKQKMDRVYINSSGTEKDWTVDLEAIVDNYMQTKVQDVGSTWALNVRDHTILDCPLIHQLFTVQNAEWHLTPRSLETYNWTRSYKFWTDTYSTNYRIHNHKAVSDRHHLIPGVTRLFLFEFIKESMGQRAAVDVQLRIVTRKKYRVDRTKLDASESNSAIMKFWTGTDIFQNNNPLSQNLAGVSM